MERVLIGASTFGAVDPAPLDRLRQAGFDVKPNPFGRKLTEDELCDLLPGVIGLIAGLEPLTRSVMKRSQLRAISRSGAGMSNVDLEAASELGIIVSNTPDAPMAAVAEVTLGAMLTLLRHLTTMGAEMREGRWTRVSGGQIEGRTVVIIGFGRIGRRVAELLHAFGATVIAVDARESSAPSWVRFAVLDDALPMADIVTLHASGDRTILGDTQMRQLKPGALVLNCARGGLVDEAALCEALDSGRVAGAWIDTFRDEPYQGRLCGYSQVLLTPHIGSFTVECRRRMEMEAAENLIDALERITANLRSPQP